VEALEKPIGDRVLQAMAQAFPDPVDLSLLSMVLGCEPVSLQETTAGLVRAGLARTLTLSDGADPQAAKLSITDKGMVVADGMATDAQDATTLLDRLEACALRQLLDQRIGASRLPAQQADELRGSLAQVSDGALMDAAQVWAHQTVSDWRALVRGMQGLPAHASPAAGSG
jgi:hypothetical protein